MIGDDPRGPLLAALAALEVEAIDLETALAAAADALEARAAELRAACRQLAELAGAAWEAAQALEQTP